MERNHSVLEEQTHHKIKHNFSFVVSLTYHSRFYHIRGVMVQRAHDLECIDRGFEPRSGQTKYY